MLLIDPQTLDRMTQARQPDLPEPSARLLRLLSEDDRLLLDMAWKHGLSRRQIGLLVHRTPGSITRKLRRVISRLFDPLVVALADPHCTLSPQQRQIGIEYFLQRKSILELATLHDLSSAEVRKTLEYLRGWHRGLTAARR